MSRNKISVLILALISLQTQALAGPVHWLKTHKRVVLEASAVAGASVLQWKATTYCQRGDVEACNIGYGARRAVDGFSIGTAAALFIVAQKCHQDTPSKGCYAIAFGMPAYQASQGIKDYLSYRPESKDHGEASHNR